MTLTRIFAHISCSDTEASRAWFEALFGRPCDDTPMTGLHEWHHAAGGLQLFHAPENAGHGTLTLIVDDIRAERQRLMAAGLKPGPVEGASTTDIVRMTDPDGNLVVLAQPYS